MCLADRLDGPAVIKDILYKVFMKKIVPFFPITHFAAATAHAPFCQSNHTRVVAFNHVIYSRHKQDHDRSLVSNSNYDVTIRALVIYKIYDAF